MNIDIIDIDTVDATTVRIDGLEFAKADCSVSVYGTSHAQIVADGETFIVSHGSAVDGVRPRGQTALVHAIRKSLSAAKTLPAALLDASSAASGTITTLGTGQPVLNFGGQPAVVSGGKIIHTPPASGAGAAYMQVELASKLGHIGCTLEFADNLGSVCLVAPSTTWTPGGGSSGTFTIAAAHFVILKNSWTYQVWKGDGGVDTLASGSLNLTLNTPYDIDIYFDGAKAYIFPPDGSMVTVSDARISSARAGFAIWELFEANGATTLPARLLELRADVEATVAATMTDVARNRSQFASVEMAGLKFTVPSSSDNWAVYQPTGLDDLHIESNDGTRRYMRFDKTGKFFTTSALAELLPAPVALTSGDATPSIAGQRHISAAGSTAITSFTGGLPYQIFYFVGNGTVQLTHSASLVLVGGVNLTPANGRILQFRMNGGGTAAAQVG